MLCYVRLEQRLREHNTMLCYTHIAYLVVFCYRMLGQSVQYFFLQGSTRVHIAARRQAILSDAL
jgi:hypothetical protein